MKNRVKLVMLTKHAMRSRRRRRKNPRNRRNGPSTKKAKKTKQKNREGDEDDLQIEAKEFAFEAYQDPSLSPAQVVIIVQQLETESARAVAQQQLWSLDTSCDRSIGRAGAHHG